MCCGGVALVVREGEGGQERERERDEEITEVETSQVP